MLDYRLYTFLTVCETLSYTKAAKILNITQPAVSQHIHYLEQLYQVTLFSHAGRNIQLSPAGKLLYQAASTARNDAVSLEDKLHALSATVPPLVFGVTMTIGEFVIATPLAAYLTYHPQAHIQMLQGNTQELSHKLISGEIQFALVEGYYNTDLFESLPYRQEAFLPLCASSHQPASLNSFEDLLSQTLITREPGSGTRQILEYYLQQHNLKLSNFARLQELGSMHAILELVARDFGISFLYQSAAKELLSTGRLRTLDIPGFSLSHNFTFIWNRGSIYRDTYLKICQELLGLSSSRYSQ